MSNAVYVVGCVFLFVLVTFYKSLTVVVPRQLYVPFNNWKDHVQPVLERTLNSDRPAVLPKSRFGAKMGSVRRRFVLASKEPILYSTVPLNTRADISSNRDQYMKLLRVAKVDRVPESRASEFMRDVNPKLPEDSSRKIIYGFFHPYCDASGGGERVLWEAVLSTLMKSDMNIAAVYTFTLTESTSVSSILSSVKSNFGLDLIKYEKNLVFVQLPNAKRWIIDGSQWKHFTLIAQSLASVYASILAVSALPPDVWVDTMGFPFTYPWISFCLRVPVIAYVHYPLISSDMLEKLDCSTVKGVVKYAYWKSILFAYALAGSYADIVLCNSTWTRNHIAKIWRFGTNNPIICYPPIGSDVVKGGNRTKTIVCVAQFRPEKRHALILEEFSKYLKETDSLQPYRLVLVGSVRDERDTVFVNNLKKTASKLGVSHLVDFKVNANHSELQELLRNSEVGVNAMWNEHFGITVVEYLFNGLIPVVHASAGPKMDICVPWKDGQVKDISSETRTGIFFTSEDDPDYKKNNNGVNLSDALIEAERLSVEKKAAMLERGRLVAQAKFGKDAFQIKWNSVLNVVSLVEIDKRTTRGDVEKVF